MGGPGAERLQLIHAIRAAVGDWLASNLRSVAAVYSSVGDAVPQELTQPSSR
jgi:hypothetical protein